MTRDNWGWRARIGLFIVGNEAVPEAEWWAMAPPGVSVHAARVTARAPWAQWNADKTAVEPADDLLRGARQFAAMRLQAVTLAHSSSSLVGGKGWDAATVASLAPVLGAPPNGPFVTTNGLDIDAALRAMHVRRPFLVLPPWFNDDTVAAGLRYYADHGFPAAGHLRYDPGRKWRDLPPGDLVGQGAGFEQEVEPLYAQIKAACPRRGRRRADRRHRLPLRGDPRGAGAGPATPGDLGQPGEPVALPAGVGRAHGGGGVRSAAADVRDCSEKGVRAPRR